MVSWPTERSGWGVYNETAKKIVFSRNVSFGPTLSNKVSEVDVPSNSVTFDVEATSADVSESDTPETTSTDVSESDGDYSDDGDADPRPNSDEPMVDLPALPRGHRR
ncbi:hypothetical protein A4X13_0g8398, partial [Tilletia indica]